MPPKRLLLEGESLEDLQAQVLAEHGPTARIVAAERVTVGGIWGLFARRHYEVTIEIADADRSAGAQSPLVPAGETAPGDALLDLPARVGIAALLAAADQVEAHIHSVPPKLQISTNSDGFADLMDELTFATAPAEAAPATVPAPLSTPGDLVLVIGLRDQALAVALSMAKTTGAEVGVAGSLHADGYERVDDRRSVLAARARGVERERSVLVAFGLDHGGRDARRRSASLGRIGADQAWVVVDVGRKSADTAYWVHAVMAVVAVDAVAVTGTDDTATPHTADELNLPIGWEDGEPASTTG